jgi:hypothetical protein
MKKVMRAQHECIHKLPTEHKHQMVGDKDHHDLNHQHVEEVVLLTHVGSSFDLACPQVRPVSSDNHKLTYHMLKKHIRERNKCNYISQSGHDIDRGGKITYRRLKQTLRNVSIENQQTTANIPI